ncbi:MAG: lysophospholipid acyltransferase family protein [Bacteroidales bacterium]|jgi:1-acyl-sn-glycerol-3-phosphate acyltransferase|nr:lysophospholipid acyltransferase family protein [Bacteroidales bacterium]NLM93319.1 glycerol acyltransferase [Bacteroidales bacterium]
MIKASHHPLYLAFFGSFIRLFLRLQFRKVSVHGSINAPGKSLLVIGNHFSWWDGFFSLYVRKKTFNRKLHVMILEEQLSRRPFLARMGAFSIKKNSRSAVESLNYAASLLDEPENMVLLFPQGRFESHHQHPLSFEQGWLRIPKNVSGPFQLVFLAYLTDYFDHPRPELSIYLKEYVLPGDFDPKTIEDDYNAFLKHCIVQQNLKA